MNKKEIQMTFFLDPELKKLAQAKAKKQGLTLKALLVCAMRAYVDNDVNICLTTFKNKLNIK